MPGFSPGRSSPILPTRLITRSAGSLYRTGRDTWRLPGWSGSSPPTADRIMITLTLAGVCRRACLAALEGPRRRSDAGHLLADRHPGTELPLAHGIHEFPAGLLRLADHSGRLVERARSSRHRAAGLTRVPCRPRVLLPPGQPGFDRGRARGSGLVRTGTAQNRSRMEKLVPATGPYGRQSAYPWFRWASSICDSPAREGR